MENLESLIEKYSNRLRILKENQSNEFEHNLDSDKNVELFEVQIRLTAEICRDLKALSTPIEEKVKTHIFGSVVVFEGLELVDDDDPFNYGEVESREELIKLCEDAVVHHTKWQDRDTYSAQKGVQSIYKGLTAGLDYLIVTKEDDNDYHSDEDTLIIEFIQPIDFDKLEKGLELKISSREDYFKDCDPNYDSEMFDSDGINFYNDWCSTYMPTRKKINEVGIGNDWY